MSLFRLPGLEEDGTGLWLLGGGEEVEGESEDGSEGPMVAIEGIEGIDGIGGSLIR